MFQQPFTLQTLQSLPGAQGSHFLLKTENGQYQLLRVGPAQTPTAAIAPNNASNTAAFRVQSVPAVSETKSVTVSNRITTCLVCGNISSDLVKLNTS